MQKFIVRYGLISGCLLIALGLVNWFLIAKQFGYDGSQTFGYLSMIVSLLTIPLGIKYFRDQLNQNNVSFGQAFKIGMGITAIPSIIMGLYSMLFFMLQGDEFLKWSEENFPPEEWADMQTQLAAMPEYVMTPWFQGIVMGVTVLLIGLFMTIISSLILRSQKI